MSRPTSRNLAAWLPEPQAKRLGLLLVVGDLVCDHYIWGDVERVSPEAPVQVLRWHQEADRAGGAANVALNLAALGCRVAVVGVVGRDAPARWLIGALRAGGVDVRGVVRAADRPTTLKTRVVARGQQLLRIDRETVEPVERASERALIAAIRRVSPTASGIICSDYGKGVLSPAVLEAILGRPSAARSGHRSRPLVLVDPKGRDFSKYRGADILTPNEKELFEADGAGNGGGDLGRRAAALMRTTGVRALLVTRGAKGMDLFESACGPRDARSLEPMPSADARGLSPWGWGPTGAAKSRGARARGGGAPRALSDEASIRHTHIPVLQTHEVYDVTGAGDTVAAVMGLAASAGLPLADAARLANAAAGIVVGSVGTAVVEPEALARVLDGEVSQPRSKILSRATLLARVKDARARGARIVFTNGCFDLLHVGHLHVLQRARALGDLLIVAINDDGSVRRLKGAGRPLVPGGERAEMIAALRFVDYVTLFPEETPLRLIRAVRPDVLVKGGDYTIDQVVGRDVVESYGGRVELVAQLPGFSTSKLLEVINQGRVP